MNKDKMFIRPKSLMIVAAHPDDIEMNCGGTIARWVSQGTRAFALIVTNGDKGGKRNSFTSAELAVIRAKEQLNAAEILGIEQVEFLGRTDGSLSDSVELRGDIVRWIRKWKPDTLMTHDPSVFTFDWGEVNHRDHRVVGEAAMDAVRPFASGRLFYPEQLTEPGLDIHAVDHVIFWETNSPNHYEDIERSLPAKVTAVACHESQYPNMKPVENWLYTRSAQIGSDRGLLHAECFKHLDLRSPF